MTDEYDHALPDDLEDRIQTYADRDPDATAAGVLGAFNALNPTDLEDVRGLLGEAKPVTSSNENAPTDEAGNRSVKKNRNANTEDSDRIGSTDEAGGDVDCSNNTSNRHTQTPTDTTDAVKDSETPDSTKDTPTGGRFQEAKPGHDDTNDDLQARAHAAFADAIEFYHDKLDTELPVDYADTARDYYENVRGWSSDTVDGKRLGYAPGECRDELIEYLNRRGHDRDAIQACGLFYEDHLRTHFNGRFVLPYYNTDDDPVYAISRSIDEANDGHSYDHHGNQKYTKAVKAQDYSVMDEPIYGLETVDADTDRLLVAGGIADAITLHEAGYACISPVTTVRFKNKHEDRVLDLIEKYDIDGVYMLNDAERPSTDKTEPDDPVDTIGRALTIKQYGEGLRGAFGNTEFLQDADAEAYLVTLPGGDDDLRKLDPDDYIKEDWGSVETVLSAAKPAADHRGYQQWHANRQTREISKAATVTSRATSGNDWAPEGDGDGDYSGDASELFTLGFTDVAPVAVGDRTDNPLGHHGNSRDYFVGIEKRDETFGYDHKYNVAYNALTYLLCDAGERRAADPNGRLSNAEMFTAWEHAKTNGCIPAADPIPLRALQHVARTSTKWDGDLVEQTTADGDTFDGLPTDVYNSALDAVANDHGLQPGRDPIGADPDDIEHTAVLPSAVRDLSTTSSEWDWRHAAESSPALSLQDARDRTRNAIADAYQYGDRRLIRALPTLGKSYGAVAAAADTDTPITVLTGRGRKEQYDQFEKWAAEHGLSYKVLPSFTEACPTAAGDHGEDWRDTVMGWYNRGATGQKIHNHAEDALDCPLPCQIAENGDRIECMYRHAWEFEPDEYDVLIGHYAHAHAEQVTAGRGVVFDEFPGNAYETALGGEILETAVSYWLQTTDAVPFDSYLDLVTHRDDEGRRDDALLYLEDHVDAPDERAVFDDDDAHAAAPFAVWTLLAAEDLGNGLEYADLGDHGTGVFAHVPDAPADPSAVRLLQPPDLPPSADVVALDGTPTLEMWELALGCGLNPCDVLQDDERAAYLRDTLNLQLVPTTEYVKPYNSGDHVNTDADAALLEAITDVHGDKPGVISTRTALDEYADADVLEYDPEDGAVEDGPAERVRWFGNVLGSNDFKQKRVGAVLGSNHFGDGYVKKWAAYAGRAVESPDRSDADNRGQGLSYGPFGDKVHRHMTEHETLQAAMRFGRDGNGAFVYVHTDTLPEWVPTAAEGRVLTTWSDGMRDVVDALEDLGTATTAALVDHPAVDLSRRQVFDHLETLRERGVLDRHQDAEDGRRVVWVDDGVHRLNDHGDVELPGADLEDLDADEVQELARSTLYTYHFTNLDVEGADSAPPTTDPPTSPPTGEVIDGEPPPEPGD